MKQSLLLLLLSIMIISCTSEPDTPDVLPSVVSKSILMLAISISLPNSCFNVVMMSAAF